MKHDPVKQEKTPVSETQALLGSLGLCKKAGKLLHGYDRVEEAAQFGKAKLVLLAQDASARTKQHMQESCEELVPCAVMPLTIDELRVLTPKPAAVFAVTDENLARLCAKHLTEFKEDTAHGV